MIDLEKWALLALPAGFVIFGVGWFGYEVWIYLKHGFWFIHSTTWGLEFLGSSWAASPDDWLGVHRMLTNLPLGLAAILVGLMVFVLLLFIL